jgi:DMSO/TMAO reductase YedYZ molybdopterin-dependent catalytic subunit
MTEPDSRRRFLFTAVTLAAAAPLLGMAGVAVAAPLKPLPVDNAQAKALAYVVDATKTKHAAFKPGSACKNCQFFTAATGACTLFAGFSVAPAGWCAAWAKKA